MWWGLCVIRGLRVDAVVSCVDCGTDISLNEAFAIYEQWRWLSLCERVR